MFNFAENEALISTGSRAVLQRVVRLYDNFCSIMNFNTLYKECDISKICPNYKLHIWNLYLP